MLYPQPKGPASYENWKIANSGDQSETAFECHLFSDAIITGEMDTGLGPYQVLNLVPLYPEDHILKPVLALRYKSYDLRESASILNRLKEPTSDQDRYHGGTLEEEVAALLSLCLGVRLRAGGITRHFWKWGAKEGKPTASYIHMDPVLHPCPRWRVLPRVLGPANLNQACQQFQRWPILAPATANVIVKCARLYQQAIWVSETAPESSWLLFVSALETAGQHWRIKSENEVERLRAWKPELVTLLKKKGGDTLVSDVAKLIADRVGAGKTFRDFVIKFLPEPPAKRPIENVCFEWTPQNFKKALITIYDHRSKALHGGTPFPYPMCLPPMQYPEGEAPAEIFATHGGTAFGGIWTGNDLPMLLHTFEYLTRIVLLNWWRTLYPDTEKWADNSPA